MVRGSGSRSLSSVLGLAVLVASALPAAAADDPKTEFGVLFGGAIAGQAASGRPEVFGQAKPAFGIRGARLLNEFLTVFADFTATGFNTPDPTIDARMYSVRTGSELLLPWLGDRTRFFVAGSLGLMKVGYSFHSGAPPSDDRPDDWDS